MFQPCGTELGAQRSARASKLLAALRLVADDVQRGDGGGTRRPGGRWKRRTAGHDSPATRSATGCRPRTRRRSPAPCSACRRGRGRGPRRPGARPRRGRVAEHAGGVGFVDHQHRVVPLGQIGQFGQRGQVAVHAEEAVGHDQPPAVALAAWPAAPPSRSPVAVRIDADVGPRQPAAVEQAGVVLAVAEDDVAGPDQGGDARRRWRRSRRRTAARPRSPRTRPVARSSR